MSLKKHFFCHFSLSLSRNTHKIIFLLLCFSFLVSFYSLFFLSSQPGKAKNLKAKYCRLTREEQKLLMSVFCGFLLTNNFAVRLVLLCFDLFDEKLCYFSFFFFFLSLILLHYEVVYRNRDTLGLWRRSSR